MGPGQLPLPLLPYPFTSPSSTQSFTFHVSFPYLLYLFSYISIPSSIKIGPLRFQAGGRRRRPNLGLVFLCLLCYMYF